MITQHTMLLLLPLVTCLAPPSVGAPPGPLRARRHVVPDEPPPWWDALGNPQLVTSAPDFRLVGVDPATPQTAPSHEGAFDYSSYDFGHPELPLSDYGFLSYDGLGPANSNTDGGANDGNTDENSSCQCVPFYQCKDGKVVTNGEGIIDIRFGASNASSPRPRAFTGGCGVEEVCCRGATAPPGPPGPPPAQVREA